MPTNSPAEESQQKSTLLVTTVTAFMAPFMLSSINVALPAIQADLGGNAVLLGWIATSYLLATAIVLVPAGKFADIHGRKKVFLSGIIIYTLGSFLAVFSPNITWFLAMRVVQGLGAAMFITTGMAILTSVLSPEKRGKGIGLLVTSVYVGLATGPFVGGLLTQFLGWRSLFGFMLLLGMGSITVTVRSLKGEWAEARGEKFDRIGSLVYALSIIFLVYGATRIIEAKAAILFLMGCLGLFLFYKHQQRTPSPLVEISLFHQNRSFLFSSLAALIHYAATFAVTFQISLFLQYIKGMQPQSAGTVLMIQPVLMALLSAQAGKLSDTVEPRILASTGMGLTALGLAFFSFLTETTPLGLIVANLALLGIGFALFSSPNMSAIMGSVERRQYGIAAGTVATMRLMGQMCSMAVATIFLAVFIGREEILPHNYPLFQTSMRSCFALFVVLCLIGIGFSLFRGNIRKSIA